MAISARFPHPMLDLQIIALPHRNLLRLPAWPILQGLRQVMRLDDLSVVQVGDRAGELQDAVKGAGAQLQLAHGRFDQRLAALVQLAELPHLGWPHVRVARQQYTTSSSICRPSSVVRRRSGQPLPLHTPRPLHPLPDSRARLAQPFAGQLVVVDARHVDVDVDTVEEGARDALLIAGDHACAARAFLLAVAVIAAGVGILAICASACTRMCLMVFSSL